MSQNGYGNPAHTLTEPRSMQAAQPQACGSGSRPSGRCRARHAKNPQAHTHTHTHSHLQSPHNAGSATQACGSGSRPTGGCQAQHACPPWRSKRTTQHGGQRRGKGPTLSRATGARCAPQRVGVGLASRQGSAQGPTRAARQAAQASVRGTSLVNQSPQVTARSPGAVCDLTLLG